MSCFDRYFQESPFVFHSENSILHEKDLGIAGERFSVLTPPMAAAMLQGIQNVPYCGSGFWLEVRVDGERITGRDWTWLPNAIRRSGKAGNWKVETLTLIPGGRNGCLMRLAFTNLSDCAIDAPVQVIVGGSIRKEAEWLFPIPPVGPRHFAKTQGENRPEGSLLHLIGANRDVEGGEILADDPLCLVTCTLPDMQWYAGMEIWETTRTVAPGETLEFDVSVLMEAPGAALEAEAMTFLTAPQAAEEEAANWLDRETQRILSRMPRFSSDKSALTALYYRSLVTYCMNRWNNPHFVIQPFYSTGSVNGGCRCSYLWDYCGGVMLHPLVDPETNRKMICMYLHADLCTSFAVTPLDGTPTGPWYHINQEKIIQMIYYHVIHTGDTQFLQETVDGRTIAQWAVFHACVGDDLSAEAELMDYGQAGDSHLELRRKYYYRGVMPDLNARRYKNFHLAYEITKMAGCPQEFLLERAETIARKLPSLWDEEAKWYDFIWEGKREKRYTVQMFKFLDSPVIDDHTKAALISHLNEKEFLSKFGLHSMSKTDAAFDQIDIDNGGGGICVQFTMQIVQQLYRIGYAQLASDILNRVLWWGTRLPYLGDSCAANMLFDREDTPLQSDISSASAAQAILFGACGISVREGKVVIAPPAVLPAGEMHVENMQLLGNRFSLTVTADGFTVETAAGKVTRPLGESVTL